MGWDSFNVVRFELEPLLQGQTRMAKLKSAYNQPIANHVNQFNIDDTGQ